MSAGSPDAADLPHFCPLPACCGLILEPSHSRKGRLDWRRRQLHQGEHSVSFETHLTPLIVASTWPVTAWPLTQPPQAPPHRWEGLTHRISAHDQSFKGCVLQQPSSTFIGRASRNSILPSNLDHMAQAQPAQLDAVPAADPQAMQQSLWRRWFGHGNGTIAAGEMPHDARGSLETEDEPRPGIIRRVSRKVVPGLPRAQTFKRQQAEVRNNLEPVQPTPAERRALSVDRRLQTSQNITSHPTNPRTSAPDFIRHDGFSSTVSAPSIAGSVLEEKMLGSIGELTMPEGVIDELPQPLQMPGFDDAASMTTSQYDNMIHVELERIWILNLSMHFRDKSKREKFFVTYREKEMHWRRVTISLDYRGAPENSLEMDLLHTKFQRDKSAKIYEAIRESLVDIQFYETITNLKLQTTDGRLHVHVVEDVNVCICSPCNRWKQC